MRRQSEKPDREKRDLLRGAPVIRQTAVGLKESRSGGLTPLPSSNRKERFPLYGFPASASSQACALSETCLQLYESQLVQIRIGAYPFRKFVTALTAGVNRRVIESVGMNIAIMNNLLI